MILLSAVIGYLIGTIPTAGALGRLRGVDLSREGSGNPGANNALRLAGPGLAAAVLFVEMAKGTVAVLIGAALDGDVAAVAAGLAAAVGNVFNVWYRFRGGKGLGITAGVLLAVWPTVLLPAIVLIAIAAAVTRSSGAAAIIAIAGLNVMAVLWVVADWPTGWGIESTELLIVCSVGLGLILTPKHWRDSSFRSRPRHELEAPGSPGRR